MPPLPNRVTRCGAVDDDVHGRHRRQARDDDRSSEKDQHPADGEEPEQEETAHDTAIMG